MGIRVTVSPQLKTEGAILATIQEKILTALNRSLPKITRLWADESRRLAPVRTGRLKRLLRFKVLPVLEPKIQLRFIFYLPPVLARQGNQNFILKAFENVRGQIEDTIALNFRLLQ